MSFDITNLKIKDGEFFVHLTNPATGELLYEDEAKEKKIGIWVCSRSSSKYIKERNKMLNKSLKQNKKVQTAESIIEDGNKMIVACSIRSENIKYGDYDPIADAEGFFKLYSDESLSWIKDQVSAFLDTDENFM